MATEFRDVDPRELQPPSSSPKADPIKLSRQIAQFGATTIGMPTIEVYEGVDGVREDETGRTLWDLEDDQLLAAMHCHRDNLRRRSSPPPNAMTPQSDETGLFSRTVAPQHPTST